MVGDATDFDKRHGGNRPSKLARYDAANIKWRKYVNTHARGQAVEPALRHRSESDVPLGPAGPGIAEPEAEPAGVEGS